MYDTDKNPIIFLDFDGVVNTIYYCYYPRIKRTVFGYAHEEDGFVNNRQAIEWLNELFFHYTYDIVVTSTWRNYCDYREILYNSGLNRMINILGATPRLNTTRGNEIAQWIIEHNEKDRHIIILDDDEDMEFLKSELIKCDPYLGFTLHEYTKCVEKFENWGCREYV